MPGTVDQKISFKATSAGINIEAEYTNKWWTKPVPLTVAAHTLERDLFVNNMGRFENLFCKKLSHRKCGTVYYLLGMSLPGPWNVKIVPAVACMPDLRNGPIEVVKI